MLPFASQSPPSNSWDPYDSTQGSGTFSFRPTATRLTQTHQENEVTRQEHRLQTEMSSQWLRFRSIAPNGRASRGRQLKGSENWLAAIGADEDDGRDIVGIHGGDGVERKNGDGGKGYGLKESMMVVDVVERLQGELGGVRKGLEDLVGEFRRFVEKVDGEGLKGDNGVGVDDFQQLKEEVGRLRRVMLEDETKDVVMAEVGKNRGLLGQIEKDLASDTARICDLLAEKDEGDKHRGMVLEKTLKNYGDEQQRLLSTWKHEVKEGRKDVAFARVKAKEEPREIKCSFPVLSDYSTGGEEEQTKNTPKALGAITANSDDVQNAMVKDEQPVMEWPWSKEKVYTLDSSLSSRAVGNNSEQEKRGVSKNSKRLRSHRK